MMQSTPGHRALILVAVLLLLSCIPLSAQEVSPAANPVLDLILYEEWLGMEPAEVCARFGAPDELFVHRGATADEDDVVFYRDGLYLFWFENRLWQLRADHNAAITLGGVAAGESRAEVSRRLGTPLHREGASDFFEFRRTAYPVRLRVVFDEDDRVIDRYLYRGDY